MSALVGQQSVWQIIMFCAEQVASWRNPNPEKIYFSDCSPLLMKQILCLENTLHVNGSCTTSWRKRTHLKSDIKFIWSISIQNCLFRGNWIRAKMGPVACVYQNNKETTILRAWAGWLSRYSDWLRAGRSGDRIPVRARFSLPVQTGPGAHPASYTMGTGSFPRVKSGRGVTLTPHPLLVPWSWKGRAIPLLPL